jgi:glucosamine--fructose-6-phosphate aminotransferase (isomerizing)
MCGIVGYIGKKDAAHVLVNGLKRLEYRGYDSAGVALMNGTMRVTKCKGKVSELESRLDMSALAGFNIGIAHTRWATHGEPSDRNAHPFSVCDDSLAMVHNGIIENYAALRTRLEEKGHHFLSETDSEVLAHLIEHYHRDLPLREALQKALEKVEGTYGIALISRKEPDRLLVARKGSPLVIGVGDDEMIVASDCSAIVEYTRQVIFLEDDEIAEITASDFYTYDLHRQPVSKQVEQINWDITGIEKQGFDHFMLKEICEQPDTILNAFRGRIDEEGCNARLDGLNLTPEDLRGIDRIIFIACGTSWHAGLIGEYLIEEYARIPVEVEYASEFRYRRPVLRENDLIIVISQSGETADTLAALREAQAKGLRVLGITNVVGSTIARESDGGIYIHAGPEIGVASTKAFTSQVTVLVLLTILLARSRDMTPQEGAAAIAELKKVREIVRSILADTGQIKKMADMFKDARNFLYLGRGAHFPVALEGALKLKEISYIHAEGYPAAEMKHGPIALIDENMPCVVLAPQDEVYAKVISNIQEVKARGGKVIVIATHGDEEIIRYAQYVIKVPHAHRMVMPLISVVPLQLLSYYIAVARGCDVDQPRNLAKSVTVE